jgi:hypothetical protein
MSAVNFNAAHHHAERLENLAVSQDAVGRVLQWRGLEKRGSRPLMAETVL